jgi:hypothetical protein
MCTVFTIRRNASLLLKGASPHPSTPPPLPPIHPPPSDIDALAQIPEEIEVIRELLACSDDNSQVSAPPSVTPRSRHT